MDFAQATVVASTTLVSLTVLGIVAAYWTWSWLAPRAEPRAPTAADAGGASAAALFGSAQQDRSSVAATGIAIRLLGIVTATPGRRGYAVVELEPRQILAVEEGDDIAPGIRLAEVGRDRILLERSGTRETLTWPDKTKAAEPPPVRANR